MLEEEEVRKQRAGCSDEKVNPKISGMSDSGSEVCTRFPIIF
jgi:hypothetical protein